MLFDVRFRFNGWVVDGVYVKWDESELERLELLEMRGVDGCGEREAFDAFVGQCRRLETVKIERCRFEEPSQQSVRERRTGQQ